MATCACFVLWKHSAFKRSRFRFPLKRSFYPFSQGLPRAICIDASVFPVQPLDRWLDDAAAASSFFAYKRQEKTVSLSSWFLAANRENSLVKKWDKYVKDYWLVRREPKSTTRDLQFLKDPLNEMRPFEPDLALPYPYFWFHHLFSILVQTDAEARKIWGACENRPSISAHKIKDEIRRLEHRNRKPLRRVWNFFFPKPNRAEFMDWISSTEMQKLDWRSKSNPLSLMKSLKK